MFCCKSHRHSEALVHVAEGKHEQEESPWGEFLTLENPYRKTGRLLCLFKNVW